MSIGQVNIHVPKVTQFVEGEDEATWLRARLQPEYELDGAYTNRTLAKQDVYLVNEKKRVMGKIGGQVEITLLTLLITLLL